MTQLPAHEASVGPDHKQVGGNGQMAEWVTNCLIGSSPTD